MSLGAKMIEVMRQCRYMPKDGYNNFHKYAYTTAAGLFAKMNEALTEQKLYASTRFELLDSRFGKKLCYNCQNGGESNPF